MRFKYWNLLRIIQFPLLIAFGTSPLVLFLYAYLAPQALPYAWVIPAAYVILLIPCLVTPGKWRFLPGIAGFFLILLLGFLTCQALHNVWFLAFSLLYSFFLLYGLQFAGLSQDQEISVFWYCTGLLLHIAAQIKVLADQISHNTKLESITTWLLVCFFLYLLLTMLSLSRSNLSSASLNRGNVPTAMRWKQILLVLGLFSLAMLLALIPAIVNGLKTVLDWLIVLIAGFFDLLWRLLSSESGSTPPSAMGDDDSSLILAEQEEAARNPFLTKLVMLLGMIFLLLAIGVVAFLLLRQLAKLLRILWSNLNRYITHASENYIDEITNTRDSGTQESRRTMRKRRRITAVDERKLSPGERIRHRYLRLLLKHPEWSAGNTVRENIPDQAAQLYERARYSDHTSTEAEVSQFIERIRKI